MSADGAVDLQVARELLVQQFKRPMTIETAVQLANAWTYLGWAESTLPTVSREGRARIIDVARRLIYKTTKETPNA